MLVAHIFWPVKIRPFRNLAHWGFQLGDKLMDWGDVESHFLQKNEAGINGHINKI